MQPALHGTEMDGDLKGRMEYADFIQISMFHPPHYHTSVVPFKNYVPFPPLSIWCSDAVVLFPPLKIGIQHPPTELQPTTGTDFSFPHALSPFGARGKWRGKGNKLCYKSTIVLFAPAAAQDHINILFLFAKLHCSTGSVSDSKSIPGRQRV